MARFKSVCGTAKSQQMHQRGICAQPGQRGLALVTTLLPKTPPLGFEHLNKFNGFS